MTDDPVALDQRRGMAAQRATDIRRRRGEVAADQAALRHRQKELEQRHPELIEHFRIETLPTICVVDARRVKARVVSPRGRKELEEALAPWLR